MLSLIDGKNYTLYDYEDVSSTQDIAHNLLQHTSTRPWTWVRAQCQSKGRGCLSKVWDSPRGGLYTTLLCPWPYPQVKLLSLAAAWSVSKVLDALRIPCALKWINDVLVEGKKIAGVLVEMSYQKDALGTWHRWCLIGIGLNVNIEPQISGHLVTSVAQWYGHSIDIHRVWNLVNDNLYQCLQCLILGQEKAMIDDICHRLLYMGQQVYVHATNGYFFGTLQGLLPSGKVILDGCAHHALHIFKDFLIEK